MRLSNTVCLPQLCPHSICPSTPHVSPGDCQQEQCQAARSVCWQCLPSPCALLCASLLTLWHKPSQDHQREKTCLKNGSQPGQHVTDPLQAHHLQCHEESQCVSDLCGFGCTQPPQLVKNICSLKIGDAIYYSGFLLTTDLKSLGISHLLSFQGCVFDAASEDCRGKNCLFLFAPYLLLYKMHEISQWRNKGNNRF